MRRPVVLAVLSLVLLAGCAQFPVGAPEASTPEGQSTSGSGPNQQLTEGPSNLPDPATDRLGWEQGYWYNESLAINQSDGLDKAELEKVIARSMARVERIRGLEFEQEVPVEVISREEYRREHVNSSSAPSLKTFDNAKFEALFLVGEDENSLAVQESNRGSSVLGFYSPAEDRIVVVSDSESLSMDETTLAHELVHALQFDHFSTREYDRSTRELYNARNGLIEGDARYVDQLYADRCGVNWTCVSPSTASAAGSGEFHIGIYIMEYFPYSDGPGFVAQARENGGWDAVNALYEDPPASSEQVIDPAKYREDAPTNVSLADRSDEAWSRVTPERDGKPYASVGQSALAAMFAYPSYDQSRAGNVVDPQTFLNVDGETGDINRTDPFNYDFPAVDGWDGDKMYVYENADGETGYVWRLVWDSPADAEEFAATYRDLLAYWGGERVDGRDDLWRIADGPYADAFSVQVDGDTVTIVNAPETDDLQAVHADAAA
ncbi:Hvo_1808 family surface protein [Halobacteriaceae archaeon GCM10025711]